MQIVRREQVAIQPLTCGTCQHWHESALGSEQDGERFGRCTRFKETRTAGMRPRCNICWVPQDAKHDQQAVAVEVQ